MVTLPWLGALLLFIVLARFTVRRLEGAPRAIVFGLLNLVGVYYFFFWGLDGRLVPLFFAYLALICGQYLALRLFTNSNKFSAWPAFVVPLLALILIRYTPPTWVARLSGTFGAVLGRNPEFSFTPYFVGISYLAFRCSHLVIEVRNGTVKRPGLWEYLGFCFFVPTLPVGPINPYSNYQRAFSEDPPPIPEGRAALRILVGLVKYLFLGAICNQLSYSGLLQDGHYHHWIDLPIAAVFYYLYLYCNFSGFCDLAIGAAGLIGVPVLENFNVPFAARNIKDFWNRWHITLSVYMRDVVFSPLSRFLAHRLGPNNVNHAIALTIVVVFLLIGIWHGTGCNYAAFGAAHALGVVTNYYYNIGLKRWLGRDGFKRYNANRWIHATAVAITFCYVAATLFLFANSVAEMRAIIRALR